MTEISLKRKIEILDAEIEKLAAQIESATSSIDEANRLIAEEAFRQQAFKQAGITRSPSKLEEHEQTLTVMQATLANAEHELKALVVVRDKLYEASEPFRSNSG